MDRGETVRDYLKRRLREAGARRFVAIGKEAGVTVSFIRKFVYGSRENPRIETVQPLLDFFRAVDEGEQLMPSPGAPVDGGCPQAHARQPRSMVATPDVMRR